MTHETDQNDTSARPQDERERLEAEYAALSWVDDVKAWFYADALRDYEIAYPIPTPKHLPGILTVDGIVLRRERAWSQLARSCDPEEKIFLQRLIDAMGEAIGMCRDRMLYEGNAVKARRCGVLKRQIEELARWDA